MHICVSKLAIIGSDNGLSPGRRQAIIYTNAGILLIQTSETNLSEILSGIHTFSFKKMHWKCHLQNGGPFCHGLNELRWSGYISMPNFRPFLPYILQKMPRNPKFGQFR